jgi:hypothetical protein
MNAQFVTGLLDPESPTPAGLMAPAGGCVDTRYAVYRNNVTCSLVEALEQGFPATRELLGKRYFHALAAEFARAVPPDSPILSVYGASLPGFIEHFPPLAHMPWLSDIARLEMTRRESHDALDCAGDAAVQLTSTRSSDLPQLIPQIHPSVRWIESRWPVYGLWSCRATPASVEPESVLIVRPHLQVQVVRLLAGGIEFLQAVDGVLNLGEITSKLLEQNPAIDFPALLALLVQQGAIAHFSCPTGELKAC